MGDINTRTIQPHLSLFKEHMHFSRFVHPINPRSSLSPFTPSRLAKTSVIQLSFNLYAPYPSRSVLSCSLAGVRDLDLGAGDSDIRQHTAALLHVDDRRARGARRAAREPGGRAGERDGAPVSEGDELATLLVVLDDPLRVLLAQRGLAGEGVRDRLAGAVVHERRRARRGRGRGDGRGDRVAGADVEAGEVGGASGVPLEPGYYGAQNRKAYPQWEKWVL